jgi:hypothetical protein
MKKKYLYQGDTPINLAGFGRIEPKQMIETELEINHPLFREIKDKITNNKKKRK